MKNIVRVYKLIFAGVWLTGLVFLAAPMALGTIPVWMGVTVFAVAGGWWTLSFWVVYLMIKDF